MSSHEAGGSVNDDELRPSGKSTSISFINHCTPFLFIQCYLCFVLPIPLLTCAPTSIYPALPLPDWPTPLYSIPSPPSETQGYKPGEKKTLDEYTQLDANDDSLARWKASLGIGATGAVDPNAPKVSTCTINLESSRKDAKSRVVFYGRWIG